MEKNTFLFEIGTEELPPKELQRFSEALENNVKKMLAEVGLEFGGIKSYATPRRLAIKINQLASEQADRFVEKKGPAWHVAFDAEGRPTPAGEGFARSCQTTVDQLQQLTTPQGDWVVYRYRESGKTVQELMPDIIQQALAKLPVAKSMRWGTHTASFVRPVHWLVMMYGKQVIPATMFDLVTGNVTYGHRFHCPDALEITHPDDYENLLEEKGRVIADIKTRRDKIQELSQQLVTEGEVLIDSDVQLDRGLPDEVNRGLPDEVNRGLLDEVTGIVEWPVPLLATFEPRFLKLPKEVLIAAMRGHQKCFPVEEKGNNGDKKLLPYFVAVSNIDSQDKSQVIAGNERVMRARLSDAAFFFESDLKISLAERREDLKNVLFQAKLGNLWQKSERIARLAAIIAPAMGAHQEFAEKAGKLCKADLMTAMVGEFPELQGIMGEHYARSQGESDEIARAIGEHYLPRSATDTPPASREGSAVAVADRLDALVGLFGTHQPPTGDKDPFGLRRAALGVINIVIHRCSLPLNAILEAAVQGYADQGILLPNKDTVADVKHFILERLPSLHVEHNSTSIVRAVLAVQDDDLNDINGRVRATIDFCSLPQAKMLIEANKRVSGILEKETVAAQEEPDISLFKNEIEHRFYEQLKAHEEKDFGSLTGQALYTKILEGLASLKEPIDAFFDNVHVNADDPNIRQNRLALLSKMRRLFLKVADISLIQW